MNPNSEAQRGTLSVVDKRRVGRQGDQAPTAEANLKPTYVQELEERVRRAEAALGSRLAELEDEARRSRRRVLQDLEKRSEERERGLLLEVLGILDDLDRACQATAEAPAVRDGLLLIGGRMDQFLKAHGCEKVSPLGEPFDPSTMEAVALMEGSEGRVTAVCAPGITQNGVLLRAAKVVVGRGIPAPCEPRGPSTTP